AFPDLSASHFAEFFKSPRFLKRADVGDSEHIIPIRKWCCIKLSTYPGVKQTRGTLGVELANILGNFQRTVFRVRGCRFSLETCFLLVVLLIKISPSFDDIHRSINEWSRVFLKTFQ